MKVKDIVNSCQNQWKELFTYNKDFVITFTFKWSKTIETYTIQDFNNYTQNGLKNNYIFEKINKRHNQEVLAWGMENKNQLLILLDNE